MDRRSALKVASSAGLLTVFPITKERPHFTEDYRSDLVTLHKSSCTEQHWVFACSFSTRYVPSLQADGSWGEYSHEFSSRTSALDAMKKAGIKRFQDQKRIDMYAVVDL